MSRLLKDCCKKEENICDMIDGLGKVVDEIDCAKKICKEVEKVKKEMEAKTNKSIEDAKAELLDLLNKFNKEKWVVGEYKWMPVGSKMPYGWVKVELEEGQTLVEGTKEGLTTGAVKKHSHAFPQGNSVWTFHDGMFFINKSAATIDEDYQPGVKDSANSLVVDRTAEEGTDNNLAAGKFAELWQYKGIDYKKCMIKKCIEKSIAVCLDNLDEKE